MIHERKRVTRLEECFRSWNYHFSLGSWGKSRDIAVLGKGLLWQQKDGQPWWWWWCSGSGWWWWWVSDTISQGRDRVTHGGQTSSTMPSLPHQWSVRCILSNAVHTTSNSKPSLQQIVQGGHQGCTPGFTMKNLFFSSTKNISLDHRGVFWGHWRVFWGHWGCVTDMEGSLTWGDN